MIAERELRRVAGQAGLGVGQAEYEYVLLCVLDTLSQTSPLSETFCLKGGTALRQLYFVNWRHSVDLDFSTLPTFDRQHLPANLARWFEQTGRSHGIEVRLGDLHRADGAARVRAQFIGPLQHPNRLLLDITLDEPVIMSPERRQVVTDLFDTPRPHVLCYTLEEILAEKLRSILERGKARDYYDVWRLLTEKQDSFDQQLTRRVFQAKREHKDLPTPAVDDFLDPTSLEAAGAYWSQDLIGMLPRGDLPAWDTVTTELRPLLSDFLSQPGQG